MTRVDIMDRLLKSSKIFLEASDNQENNLSFTAHIQVNLYFYGLKGLPSSDFRIALSAKKSDDSVIHYNLVEGPNSHDQKVWNRIFRTASEDDIGYYLTKIYSRLKYIADCRGLLCYSGTVYQLPVAP